MGSVFVTVERLKLPDSGPGREARHLSALNLALHRSSFPFVLSKLAVRHCTLPLLTKRQAIRCTGGGFRGHFSV